MADQSYWFPEGIAKDVPVKIHDHYVLTDFLVLDMGEEEQDPPIVLGRPFLNTTRAIIYIRTGEIHFQFWTAKVRCYFNSYTNYEQPKKNRSRRRRQKKQTPRSEEENKSVAMKDKDEEPATPEKSPPKKQEWRKKETSPSSTEEVDGELTLEEILGVKTEDIHIHLVLTKIKSTLSEGQETSTSSTEETPLEPSVPPSVTADTPRE